MGSPCYSGTVSALKMVVGFWFPGISVMREAPLLRKDTALLSSLFWVLGECLLRDYPDFMVSSFNKPPPFHSMESFKGMPPVRDIKILTNSVFMREAGFSPFVSFGRRSELQFLDKYKICKVLRRELTENECTGKDQDAGKEPSPCINSKLQGLTGGGCNAAEYVVLVMARFLNPANNSLMQMYRVILIPPSKLNQVTHTSRSFDLVVRRRPFEFQL
ncbi:hypothetical protein NC652_023357 [Populus alba x Populus x berolinensis]|nr:hypothetical protein NC652_023357 [Populus alba x Populus x berolinensis]